MSSFSSSSSPSPSPSLTTENPHRQPSSQAGTRWLRLSPHLKTRRPSSRVLIIAITNPPYNLLDGNLLSELKRVLLALRPTATGAVILTSDLQDIFLSHYSVAEILSFSSLIPIPLPASLIRAALAVERFTSFLGFRGLTRRTPLAPLSHLNLYHEVTHLLRSIPQVTIAAINGRAFGGGCELALACDYRIMIGSVAKGVEDDISAISRGIGQPEIALGLIPGGGGTQMLSRLLGPAKALDLCLSGRLLSAKEALQLGLLHAVVEDQRELTTVSIDLAKRMARRNPTAIQCIKDSIHVGASMSLADGMRREQGNFGRASLTPEATYAMSTYLRNIDHFLGTGENSKPEEFYRPLVEGTFIDMTPGGAERQGGKRK